MIEQVPTGSAVGVSVDVGLPVAVGVAAGLVPVDEEIPQIDRAKTRTPLLAPIMVCFKYSNFGLSLLKKTPSGLAKPSLAKQAVNHKLEACTL